MSAALTLAVSFTGHPEYPLMAGAAVVVGAGVFWPGPGSALSRLKRRRTRSAAAPGPAAAQSPETAGIRPHPDALRLP